MLTRIKRFFDKLSVNSELTDKQKKHAQHLAISVLFVEMCRMDGQVSTPEIKQMNRLLEQQFSLTDAEKQELTSLAHEELDQSVDYYQFTSVINQHFDHSQKIEVIAQLWKIAFSDGNLNAHEEHYLRKICSLLHVSHADFIKTKLRAERS
jgi:uncharacterized tellurite resistance protein B-like protein